jgi:hypothetical protein
MSVSGMDIHPSVGSGFGGVAGVPGLGWPGLVVFLTVVRSRSAISPTDPCIVSIPLELVADGLDGDVLARPYPALG